MLIKNMHCFVSIIIACRNEEEFISKCLDSIINSDYPKDKLEILVVDGKSEDGTREIVKKYIEKYPFIKLLDNQKKIKPCALNMGIKEAKGEAIMVIDAHSVCQKDYISKCLEYLKKYKVDNIGGIIKTLPAKNTVVAKAIAISLSHFFGVGGSRFRVGSKKPRWVDTVFGGCYRKEVFKKIGLFNENLVRSQDMEFNLRLKRAGGKILLVPNIVSYYYPKSNLKDFFIHNIKDGIWAIYPLKFIKTLLKLRHYIPLAFILTFPISIWVYIPVAIFFSFRIAWQKRDLRYFFTLPVVFASRHIGYGLGSIWGFVKLLF